jgi:hypothetical protein
MKAGTAGEYVPWDVISVMMVEDPRRNVPSPQSRCTRFKSSEPFQALFDVVGWDKLNTADVSK